MEALVITGAFYIEIFIIFNILLQSCSGTPMYRYKIFIDPQPTPRPRFRVQKINKGGKVIEMVKTYYPQNYSLYKKTVGLLIQELNIPYKEYGVLYARFASPYPKNTAKKRLIEGQLMQNKYDLDNVEKGLMDAMQDIGLILDDKQICIKITDKVRTAGRGYISFDLFEVGQ
jgi:Holliday junction resolvase RusA-like endonuclease